MELWQRGTLLIFVITLLSSALVSGAPSLSNDTTPNNYGKTETLKCTDANYTSGSGYNWFKDGDIIFNNDGEVSTSGKYSESIDGTTFKLVINNIDVSDEGNYKCNHRYADSNTFDLKVESRGTFTLKLSSSKQLKVTWKQVYPVTTLDNIICDSNTVSVSFVSSVADGDRFTSTWLSTDTFSTEPGSCTASVTLISTFIGITVIVLSRIVEGGFKLLCWHIAAMGGGFSCLASAGTGGSLHRVKTRKFFCNCFYYWKRLCCCLCVWIWNCFYYWKPKCCCKCVRNICDCCKNCNVKGLPTWYRILWLSVIGIPVALGILSVWIVYRILCKNAVRYVLITDDGTSINDDGTWTLGASVGTFCVTKVTPGGPADGKLKVEDQIYKINGIPVAEKNPDEFLAMLNDNKKLTLHVLKVGSVCTSESTFELEGQQLGFEYEYIAMVTNVTEGGKAEGKMENGDLILSINGKSTAGKSNAEVNKELKKPEVMELSIKRAGEDNKTIRLDLKGKASLGIAIEKVGENIEVSNIEPQSAAAAAAKISGEIKVGDCILCVNGVSTAGLQVVEIEEMLTFSIILKVTKDVTLKELDPDKDGSFGFETFPPSTSTSVALNKQTAVTSVIPDRPANVVKSVTPNGPAALHGIKAGDTIVSINNEETKGKSHQEIKAMLETFGTSISLKIEENDKPNQTNGHGGNDIEMGHVNPRAQDSGRVQTLETTEEKQDFMKPLLDDKC